MSDDGISLEFDCVFGILDGVYGSIAAHRRGIGDWDFGIMDYDSDGVG